MPRVLLVTNDFPPKVGGIQVVQKQLVGALDPGDLVVLAAAHAGAAAHDAPLPYRVERTSSSTMLPTPALAVRLDRLLREVRPDVVVFGSALPLSLLGSESRRHGIPYVTMVYGADVSVPGLLPGTRGLLKRVLAGAGGVVAMGPWVAGWARRVAGRATPPLLEVWPGVDTDRFSPGDRAAARRRLGLPVGRPTVVSVSRLVPRKGMHLLVQAAGDLLGDVPGVQVVIGGTGREAGRLERMVAERDLGGTVRLLGRVSDDDLVALYRAADVFAMLCHDRWGGLEAEGFGIVFVEAGACGIPVVAGRSGGATDAVADGVTGRVVDATDRREVVVALRAYLADPEEAVAAGRAGRDRAVAELTWDHQAGRFRDWMDARFGAVV